MKVSALFRSLRQGILVCDKQGKVTYCNKAYEEFVGLKLEDMSGRNISELRHGSRVPEVLSTGMPVEETLRQVKKQSYFANIYPVIENGEVAGTISIVTTLEQKRRKTTGQKTLKEKTAEFERQEIQDAIAVFGGTLEGKKQAAEYLGISLSTLYNKLGEHGK